jgi:signal transduction histidine kinase
MAASDAELCNATEHLRDELADLQAERQRLVETLSLAERDRQLLGYELHDGIVQDLAAAVMHLEDAAQQIASAPPATRESLHRGIELVRGAIAEARRLIGGVAAIELSDVGLIAALERLADKYRDEFGLDLSFSCEAAEPNLSPAARLMLLRIAQEALNNAWKHARSSRVQIRLSGAGGALELSVADSGPGFNVQSRPLHFGLDGMRARAHILGADLNIDSRAGQGTRIVVRLALPQPTGREHPT